MGKLITILLIASQLVFHSGVLVAQEQLVISGTVRGAADSLPIPGAHVRLADDVSGTATDGAGRFHLRVSLSENSILVISCLGYRSEKLSMKEITAAESLGIFLSGEEWTLPAAHIIDNKYPAFRLVRKAVARIPANYDPKPAMLSVFYREYLRVFADELRREFNNPRKAARKKKRNLDNSIAYNVTEGVFEVYKQPYFGKDGNKNDLVRLIRVRRISFDPRTIQDSVVQSVTHRFTHKGGPHDLLRRDMMKHPEKTEFLSKRAHRKYAFRTVGIVDYEGRGTFKIIFDQKAGQRSDGYNGAIYIDTASYAFVHIAFGLSPRGIDHQSLGLPFGMLSLLTGVEMKLVKFQGEVTYREHRGMWYPGFQQFAGKLNVRMEQQALGRKIKVDLMLDMHGDLMVTQIDRIHARPFERNERFNDSDAMDDFITPYDDPFWSRFDHALPSDALISVLRQEEKMR